MTGLLARVSALPALETSWQAVLAADREDGVLGPGVQRFLDDADDRLERLSTELSAGTYRPGPLAPVEIPREHDRPRLLHVPPVRDRIVERSMLTVLNPLIDPLLGPFAFGYRPGLGVADAVQAVVRWRAEGLTWVARTDVDECFPSLPLDRVRERIAAWVADPDLITLIEILLARPLTGVEGGGVARKRGVPQGSPLSPLWANSVLAEVDEVVSAEGFPVARYADDLAIGATSRAEAEEALRVVERAVADLGMSIGQADSAAMSFEEGFCFLGEDFGPRYPPELDQHRVEEPDRKVVYVALQGARAATEAGRLRVESRDDVTVLDVPLGHISRVVVFGSVGVSAALRSWALANEADVVFLSRRGSYLGQLYDGGGRRRIQRLRLQVARSDDADFRVAWGRTVLEGKVSKQIVLLQRLQRRGTHEAVAEAVAAMKRLRSMFAECATTDELMGVEGAAAKEYFAAVAACVPENVRFSGRSRRPPLDVINAALGYGYAILLGEVTSALVANGLDPGFGLLHTSSDSRPALALDLMEEFRPLIVDQVVVAAARAGQLTPSHGRPDGDGPGVLLTSSGKSVVTDAYERRMQQFTRGALPDTAGTLRRHLYLQAQRLAGHLADPTRLWTPLSWR